MDFEFIKNFFFILGVSGTLIFLFIYLFPIGLYFMCQINNVDIKFSELVFMKFRKTDIRIIVQSSIFLKNKGIKLDHRILEVHYIAGGDVLKLIDGIVYAKEKGIEIKNEHLMKAELAQKNLKELIDKYIENSKYYGDDYSIESIN